MIGMYNDGGINIFSPLTPVTCRKRDKTEIRSSQMIGIEILYIYIFLVNNYGYSYQKHNVNCPIGIQLDACHGIVYIIYKHPVKHLNIVYTG